VGGFQGSKTHILMWGAGLGRPPIMGEGLNSLGQGKIGRGVVVIRRDGGRGLQVADGTDSRSMGVKERYVAWLFANVGWVGCRWWEDCQRFDELFIPVIWQIECGRAAGGSVDCRVVFGRRVLYGGSVQGMVLFLGHPVSNGRRWLGRYCGASAPSGRG